MLAGAVLVGAGLLLAARASTPLMFQLSYGGIVGLGTGAFAAPMIATVMGWFNTQRGLAVSLVSAGVGVAPMTVSPFAAWLIASHDWRDTMSVIGVSAMAATTIYSLEGLAGLGGRLLFGVGADRFGVKRVLVTGLLIQSLAIAAYLLINDLSEFHVLATIFGIAYGGVMPLYAVLARDYFSQSIMGAVFGALTMMSSIGMALGPLAGGWIFDQFNAYRWLYLGSAAVALGAFAIALTFPQRRPTAAGA